MHYTNIACITAQEPSFIKVRVVWRQVESSWSANQDRWLTGSACILEEGVIDYLGIIKQDDRKFHYAAQNVLLKC